MCLCVEECLRACVDVGVCVCGCATCKENYYMIWDLVVLAKLHVTVIFSLLKRVKN